MSATTWSKFFWSDWESDEALKLCSPGAQALWMRMLCICSKADGYLVIAGQSLDAAAMAKSTGWPVADVKKWWAELARWKVFSATSRGKVYSRRMVKEAKRAETARENGKSGGNPSLRKEKENQDWDNRFPTDHPGARRRLNHLPSAIEKGSNDPSLSPGKPERASRKAKTPIAEGFPGQPEIAEAVEVIAAAGVVLDATDHAKRFRGHALTNDRRVADWGAAWRSWIEIEIGKAPAAAAPPPPVEPFTWPGPAEVWGLAVSRMGPDWAAGYVGRCAWRDGALICPSPTLAKGIRTEIGRDLDGLGYRLLEGQAA